MKTIFKTVKKLIKLRFSSHLGFLSLLLISLSPRVFGACGSVGDYNDYCYSSPGAICFAWAPACGGYVGGVWTQVCGQTYSNGPYCTTDSVATSNCSSGLCCSCTDTCCVYCNPGDCGTTGGGGGGGSTTTYGRVIGRVVSDLNFDGGIATSEMWGNIASTCAGLKSDALNFSYSGSNILKEWGCNPGAYYRTNDIVTGSGRSIALTGVPTSLGYDCSRTNWSYTNTDNASYNRSGTGCTASDLTITQNETQHLWFYMVPNRAPTLSLSSPINFTSSTIYKVKPAVRDYESGGQLFITASTTVGSLDYNTDGLWFTAYGSPNNGVYPRVLVYGWNRFDGKRYLLTSGADFEVTGVPKTYWVYEGTSDFLFYDIEFTNDASNSLGDRNLYVGPVSVLQDPFGWSSYSTDPAYESSLIQLDRFDPDDGYDVIPPTVHTIEVDTVPVTFTEMNWSGSIRYPFPWLSPNAPTVGGRITVTARDNYNASATGFIDLVPKFRRLSGFLYKLPYSSLYGVDCPTADTSDKFLDSGASVVVTHEPYFTDTTGPVNADGTYSVGNIFGAITQACLTGLNTTSSPFYRLVCRNEVRLPGLNMCSGFSDFDNKDDDMVLNFGLQPILAEKWFTTYNGDISAAKVALQLPFLPPTRDPSIADICLSTYYCSSLSYPDYMYYVLGYPTPSLPDNPSSILFTAEEADAIGPDFSKLTMSGMTATNLGTDYRSDYESFLTSTLKDMINGIVAAYKSGKIDGNTHSSLPTELPLVMDMAPNSINIYAGETFPDNFQYRVASGNIAFLIIPQSGLLPIKINKVTALLPGRLIIIADREVHVGERVVGTTVNTSLSAIPLDVTASIITTKDFVVRNYNNSDPSTGTLGLEGPVISGNNVVVERNFTYAENEKRPALYVRYNAMYLRTLNDTAYNNLLNPLLDALMEFNFSSEER